jgi:basic amino acid/polyamine antiporter, APA family
MENKEFKPSLTLVDATMIVAGSMIGSGIFKVGTSMLQDLGSGFWLIAAWVITGVMTMVAAISYGELGGMFPKAGGQYVYLREAYNDFVAFLYGWGFFAVIQTGTIAAVAVAFASFSAHFFPDLLNTFGTNSTPEKGHFAITYAQVLAISLIAFLTWVNSQGTKFGKNIQTIFTTTKLLSLFGLIIAGFIAWRSDYWASNMQGNMDMAKMVKDDAGKILLDANNNLQWKALTGIVAMGAVASAMVGSVFSSDAWNNVTFVAGEIKNPKKNIGLSLVLGTLIVTIIYILVNIVYLGTAPISTLATEKDGRIALVAAKEIFGNNGASIIAIMIMISTFGCINGMVMAGARVYYTMANDKLFFQSAKKLNKKSVPAWSLWAQFVMAALLCLSGKYGDLLDMVSFVVVAFYVLTILGIFLLRKKMPNAERPYKAFGYPIMPALYILMGISFCILLLKFKPEFTYPGLGIVLLGIPIYLILKNMQKKTDV